MKRIAQIITAIAIAVLFIAAVAKVSERRDEYMQAESNYWQCINDGLSDQECREGIF